VAARTVPTAAAKQNQADRRPRTMMSAIPRGRAGAIPVRDENEELAEPDLTGPVSLGEHGPRSAGQDEESSAPGAKRKQNLLPPAPHLDSAAECAIIRSSFPEPIRHPPETILRRGEAAVNRNPWRRLDFLGGRSQFVDSPSPLRQAC
jgi:hypothetical protein